MSEGNGAQHSLRYDVNLSILFTELPVPRRPAAARDAGFDAIEFWWPFTEPVPGDREVDEFVRAVRDAGVDLVGLNFYAGDMKAGDRGLVSWVGREREFADNVDVAIGVADQLGCRSFNALYGNRIDGIDPADQDKLALSNLELAANAASAIGARLVLEPLSGAPAYPLTTAAHALDVIDQLGRDDVLLLADLYHLAANGDDIDAVIAGQTARMGHVQIADAPGRGAPGTGALDIHGHLARLQAAGYSGHVGIEYSPGGDSLDSLDWLPRERRGTA
ncbi:hydroxypyruvate isomerase family protein [Amycolatopsis palatopharyngis]|uniref:hydroxypyruvate isomerase family protein n=1 Tax=Amycolatopsis palatopharyngis TaxID=187982 RepID=UPI000E268789|nr:TIM barrel protein [Amycolatopsis palatopharyngis]